MNDQTTVPSEFRGDLTYLQPQDLGRLMASMIALGGEVFLLKAEVQRLRLALQARGGPTPPEVEAAGESDAFKAWLDTENKEFARVILDPFAGTVPVGTTAQGKQT